MFDAIALIEFIEHDKNISIFFDENQFFSEKVVETNLALKSV